MGLRGRGGGGGGAVGGIPPVGGLGTVAGPHGGEPAVNWPRAFFAPAALSHSRPLVLDGVCGGACCARCGSLVLVDVVDVDHVQPLALGGEDTDGNVQPLCHGSHLAKTGEDFRAGTGRVPARAPVTLGRRVPFVDGPVPAHAYGPVPAHAVAATLARVPCGERRTAATQSGRNGEHRIQRFLEPRRSRLPTKGPCPAGKT
ncbi:HNH endonuclease [Streptomyces sp. NPDC050988]|uniref:HNH endonuclease n=1 Tax=Streptomyces sp. NPDC050988 TaxID=3365637 RepID=UPI00379BF315